MIPSLKDKLNVYVEIYNKLHQKFKWQIQNQILMSIPLIYILNNKDFEFSKFNSLCEYIKTKTEVFSPLHSYQRLPIAAMLISKFPNPEKEFEQLVHYQQKLIQKGYKKSPFLPIAALALMTTVNNNPDLDLRIEKAMNIYREMKRCHFFLTSQNDYPLSILLSREGKPVNEIIDGIEYYYKKLSEENFKKGNDLQFLSHILMLTNIENKDFLIYRCNNICTRMVNEGLKIKRFHYPEIGIMAIIDSDFENEIPYIKEIFNSLNSNKKFRWFKDFNLMVAIILVLSEIIKKTDLDTNIIETEINTSIECITEAKNSVLIASISSASTASIT